MRLCCIFASELSLVFGQVDIMTQSDPLLFSPCVPVQILHFNISSLTIHYHVCAMYKNSLLVLPLPKTLHSPHLASWPCPFLACLVPECVVFLKDLYVSHAIPWISVLAKMYLKLFDYLYVFTPS